VLQVIEGKFRNTGSFI